MPGLAQQEAAVPHTGADCRREDLVNVSGFPFVGVPALLLSVSHPPKPQDSPEN